MTEPKQSVKVAVEYVEWLQDERRKINQLDFQGIEWTKDGKALDIPQQVKDDFEFTGLNNIDFIASAYYQKGKQSTKVGNIEIETIG